MEHEQQTQDPSRDQGPGGWPAKTTESIWAAVRGSQGEGGVTWLTAGQGRGWRVPALLALFGVVTGLSFAAWGELETVRGVGQPASILLALACALPVALLPGRALIAWRVLTVALTGAWVAQALDPFHIGYPWPWPIVTFLLYLGVTFWVAARPQGGPLLGMGIVSCTLVFLAPAVLLWGGPRLTSLIASGLVVLALLVGDALRARRAAEHSLARRTAEHEADLTREALNRERTRIARELHDVVTHHMSMIAVQAQAAPLREELPPQAAATFELIESTARSSLTELRRIVGLLRAEDPQAAAELAPAPAPGDLEKLIDQVRAAGQDVDFHRLGGDEPLPAGVEVSVYRIVQEALTNVRRHAPGAPVQVRIERTGGRVVVQVDNGPVVRSLPVDEPPTASGTTSATLGPPGGTTFPPPGDATSGRSDGATPLPAESTLHIPADGAAPPPAEDALHIPTDAVAPPPAESAPSARADDPAAGHREGTIPDWGVRPTGLLS